MKTNFVNHYHFIVEWGGTRNQFSEVSGLNMEIDLISFREGSSKVENEMKVPGLIRYSNVSLQRGIVRGDTDFYKWISTKNFGEVERRDVTITLLNEVHEPIFVWRLKNSFPVSYMGPILKGNDSEIAVETLVLTHEGMTVESL